MKNYKSLSVYKDRDVYVFGASGGGDKRFFGMS